jgi:putative membrane protein
LSRAAICFLRFHLDLVPFPLLGVSLAIFLGVPQQRRVCALRGGAPDLGRIVNAARALTSQVATCLPEDGDGFERRLFVQRLIAFEYALTAPAARHRSVRGPGALPAEGGGGRTARHALHPGGAADRVRLMLSRAGRKRGRASRCCGYWMRK